MAFLKSMSMPLNVFCRAWFIFKVWVRGKSLEDKVSNVLDENTRVDKSYMKRYYTNAEERKEHNQRILKVIIVSPAS